MRKNIEALIASSVTPYRVAKDTGITLSAVQKLFNGITSIDNIKLKNAETLSAYWEANHMVKLNGIELELEVLATYMDDELRESVNDMEFLTNQEYIELYIQQAREHDPQFIEILASEFGVEV